MEKIVFDYQMEFALKFKWEEENPYNLSFEGVEVLPDYGTGKPVFFCYETGSGDSDINVSFEKAYELNKLLNGFIKWDGCMEIHDFSYHWCYHNNFAQRIVDLIYKEGKEIMKENWSE